ncbi:hypothetical protein L3V82_03645 [Thiotrichales bacterium 19S3-7]|nr:hypothetical protein [Thiotrichales bacterium 19S3-7]MCF6801259.1 hypothetical protein [Thiotrichales bacterium 19S3-11]
MAQDIKQLIEQWLQNPSMSFNHIPFDILQIILRKAMGSPILSSELRNKLYQQMMATGDLSAMQVAMLEQQYSQLNQQSLNKFHIDNVLFQARKEYEENKAKENERKREEEDLFLKQKEEQNKEKTAEQAQMTGSKK